MGSSTLSRSCCSTDFCLWTWTLRCALSTSSKWPNCRCGTACVERGEEPDESLVPSTKAGTLERESFSSSLKDKAEKKKTRPFFLFPRRRRLFVCLLQGSPLLASSSSAFSLKTCRLA